MSFEMNGGQGKVIYLDTEGNFRPERVGMYNILDALLGIREFICRCAYRYLYSTFYSRLFYNFNAPLLYARKLRVHFRAVWARC